MEIYFYTDELELKRVDSKIIPTFNRNHIYATFEFDEEWKDLCKYALFVAPNGDKYIVYLGYGKDKYCLIPNEVLQNAFFNVSVFADDLLTSTQVTVMLSPSGYSLDLDNIDLDEDSNVYIANDDLIRQLNEDDLFIQPGKKFEKEEHPYY